MPEKTMDLLDELEARYGMNNDHFRQLHHFGPKASLNVHRSYCANTGAFRAGGQNERVRRRLQVALKVLKEGDGWEAAIRKAIDE